MTASAEPRTAHWRCLVGRRGHLQGRGGVYNWRQVEGYRPLIAVRAQSADLLTISLGGDLAK